MTGEQTAFIAVPVFRLTSKNEAKYLSHMPNELSRRKSACIHGQTPTNTKRHRLFVFHVTITTSISLRATLAICCLANAHFEKSLQFNLTEGRRAVVVKLGMGIVYFVIFR